MKVIIQLYFSHFLYSSHKAVVFISQGQRSSMILIGLLIIPSLVPTQFHAKGSIGGRKLRGSYDLLAV